MGCLTRYSLTRRSVIALVKVDSVKQMGLFGDFG